MKKKVILCCLLVFICITGCKLNNNPTSKVEELLGKYQMLDNDIPIHYSLLSFDKNIDDEDLKKRYEKLIDKQYKNLSYEIKEEKIDGNKAIVTVQIKVLDYGKIFKTLSADLSTHNQILDRLEKVKDKVEYTIEFEVNKDAKGNWELNSLTNDEEDKLLGVY